MKKMPISCCTDFAVLSSSSNIDPCMRNECKKGSTCEPAPFGTGYTCKCQIGWQGRYCEKGKLHFLLVIQYTQYSQ